MHYDSFIVPTGLISKDEIMDTGFRTEFATLNHNGLGYTIKNPITNRVEYNFATLMPVNFEGALRGKVDTLLYNNLDGEYESAYSTAYRRTIESNSIDYYSFRLGLGNIDYSANSLTVSDKYLLNNGDGSLSLPMYNNSFYFYFGLHDGETALDRFYKEYFAPCPELNEDTTVVKVSVTDAEPCGENTDGSVKVMFANLTDDPFETVNYSIVKLSEGSGSFVERTGSVPAGDGEFEVDHLPKGVYCCRKRSCVCNQD